MKLNKRAVFLILAFAVLLAGLTFLLTPRPESTIAESEPAAAPMKEAPAGVAVVARHDSINAGAPALATVTAPVVHEDKSETPECAACRQQSCTNYSGLGVDFVKGCYKEVSLNVESGPEKADPHFTEDCVAAVRCASRTGCANNPMGAARCYCGNTISIDECAEHGPGPDAPCVDEWRRATRTNSRDDINARFSDIKYPSGWAMFLLECDQKFCKSTCSS